MVDVTSGSASGGDADGDQLSSIENLQGSEYGERFSVDNSANLIFGTGGSDILWGRGGSDILNAAMGPIFFDTRLQPIHLLQAAT